MHIVCICSMHMQYFMQSYECDFILEFSGERESSFLALPFLKETDIPKYNFQCQYSIIVSSDVAGGTIARFHQDNRAGCN